MIKPSELPTPPGTITIPALKPEIRALLERQFDEAIRRASEAGEWAWPACVPSRRDGVSTLEVEQVAELYRAAGWTVICGYTSTVRAMIGVRR